MKHLLFVFFILTGHHGFTQAPGIEWQNTIGGNADDESYTIQQTSDGGYILGGRSTSGISGDKTEEYLGGVWGDFWVVKLDNIGNIQWQNTLGGDSDDYINYIIESADGGYLLGGYSKSDISPDKSEDAIGDGYYIGADHFNYEDYWIVKLDPLGNIVWDNTIGGDGSDILNSVEQTSDGGYILAGTSTSVVSGDKTESLGSYDCWLIKVSNLGVIEWQNTYGGIQSDWLLTAKQTIDGGYILGGISCSGVSEDKSEDCLGGPGGAPDYWIIKVNEVGDVEWDNTIGGLEDDYLYSNYSLQQTSDEGYILAGYSFSNISGDKSEANIGTCDFWVLKLNSAGEISWQNTIGGSSDDRLLSVEQLSDGGYILGGFSKSPISGDKTEEGWGGGFLGYDYWIVRIDSVGVVQWDKTFGGTSYDGIGSIRHTSDNGYILVGSSLSELSGDKTEESIGGYDFWIIKLNPDCVLFQEVCNNLDDDCDGAVDEGLAFVLYFLDFDGDNYGTYLFDSLSCMPIAGYVIDSTDCDDNNPYIYPGAEEILNNLDDNCNELIDEGVTIENYELFNLSIFPNPSTNTFTFAVNTTFITDVSSLIITDLSGKILSELSITSAELTIDVSNFAAGIYILRFQNDDQQLNEKFVVQ